MTVTKVTYENASEFEAHKFVAEASDLEIKPGEWPQLLDTDLGNGMPFIIGQKQIDAEGDLMWITYNQCNGCISLKIFND